MLIFKSILFGLILPAVFCGGIVAAVALLKLHDKRGWLSTLAVVSGYIVGYLGLEGQFSLPPKEGIHWLFYLALISFIGATIRFFPNPVRWSIAAFVSILIPRFLLNAMFKYTWGTVEEIIWWGCLALAIFGFWLLVEWSTTVLPTGASIPFVFFGIAGGSTLILALSGSFRLAQHNGILVATFGTIWLICLILPRLTASGNAHYSFLPGASAAVVLLLTGLWLNGYFYAEVPAGSAILLAISPIFAWIGGTRKSAVAQIALIALPVLLAIGIAIIRSGFF